MKKPVEAIERMRGFYGSGHLWDDSVKIVLSYLDSMPEWPADLTRERLEELVVDMGTRAIGTPERNAQHALRRLSAIAPKRGKRKVELWNHESLAGAIPPYAQYAEQDVLTDGVGGWRKVGEVEIDA